MMNNRVFRELTELEQMEIEGGLGPVAVFGLGLLGTAIAAGVDEIVERSTGKDIAEHTWDLIERIF